MGVIWCSKIGRPGAVVVKVTLMEGVKYLQWPRLFSGWVHEGMESADGNGEDFRDGSGYGLGRYYGHGYGPFHNSGRGNYYGKGRGYYYGGLDV